MSKQKLVGYVARRGETIVRDFALPGEQHALANGYEWMPVYAETKSGPGEYAAEPEVGVVKGMMQTSFRIVNKATDNRVGTCYLRENADLIVTALNDYHRALNAPPIGWASLDGNDVTAFYAFDPGAGVEPLYRRAPPALSARVAWNAAVTLANNICVQESNRINDDDGSAEAIHMASECARRIRGWLDPTEDQFKDMLEEAAGRRRDVSV